MRTIFWKIVFGTLYILIAYQNLKHLYQDVTGGYIIDKGIVIGFGEGWESTGGEGTLDTREMLIVKFKNGKTESGFTRLRFGIQIGDTVTCKLYGDVDPIFIEHNGKNIDDEPISDFIFGSLKWLIIILGSLWFFYYIISPILSKIFQKT
jgi:hypothetical protein